MITYCYFTAEDGVYSMSSSGTGLASILIEFLMFCSIKMKDIQYTIKLTQLLLTLTEMFCILMMRHNSKTTIYKYDLDIDLYIDTIVVDGNVRDIAFY